MVVVDLMSVKKTSQLSALIANLAQEKCATNIIGEQLINQGPICNAYRRYY
jgi:hypothetical protein